jgi:hypothetical protein
MYIKIEGCRLNWFREHQPEIRADLYKGIVDSITAGETRASAVGIRTVLPGTFQGCYRDMKKRHMDAMALVTTYGKPDVFLTMTCNPTYIACVHVIICLTELAIRYIWIKHTSPIC